MESLDGQYHEVNLSRPIVAVEVITLLDGIRPEQGGLEGPNWGYRGMLLWVDRGVRAKFHVTYVGGASDRVFVPWTSACSDPHCSGGGGGGWFNGAFQTSLSALGAVRLLVLCAFSFELHKHTLIDQLDGVCWCLWPCSLGTRHGSLRVLALLVISSPFSPDCVLYHLSST